MRRILVVCIFALASVPAVSQNFPVKPIRIVLTAPAGPTDSVSRLIGNGLTERVQQQVVSDGRGGANGIIGTEIVAKASPDGYTLLMSTNAFAISPGIYKKLPYDPLKDFAPISMVATSGGLFLVVHPSVPVKNVKEFIELAKSQPGQITFGSGGVGNVTHMAGELFNMMAGTKLNHVPYKGVAWALTDVLGGHISAMFPGAIQAGPHVLAGRLRALGFTGMTRSKVLPDVLTLDELGLKGFDITSWYGMFAPAKTPKRILSYLHENIVAVVKEQQARNQLENWGLTPIGSTPEEFTEVIKKDMEKYARIAREANIPKS